MQKILKSVRSSSTFNHYLINFILTTLPNPFAQILSRSQSIAHMIPKKIKPRSFQNNIPARQLLAPFHYSNTTSQPKR